MTPNSEILILVIRVITSNVPKYSIVFFGRSIGCYINFGRLCING